MSRFKCAPVSSAALVPAPAPERAGTPRNKNAAGDFDADVQIPRSIPAGRRCARKKMFLSDYPRGPTNWFWLFWFPGFDPFPVAAALAIAFLPARLGRAISQLRLPPPPFPRFLPATLAAISLARLPRLNLLFTLFEQTTPRARPPGSALPPARRLIFAPTCTTLGRAHGR
jgi:hypothetical protein